MQIRISSACEGGSLSVSVVMSASAMVAVRPGRAPMTTPTSEASRARPIVEGEEKWAMDWPNRSRPSNMVRGAQGRRTRKMDWNTQVTTAEVSAPASSATARRRAGRCSLGAYSATKAATKAAVASQNGRRPISTAA